MSDLERVGLFFDDSNNLRLLEPEASLATTDLSGQCTQFVDHSTDFSKVVTDFVNIVDKLAAEVDNQKIKAIGSRNQLQSVAKERDQQKQQLEALVAEKRQELERLRTQYQWLQRLDAEQTDLIDMLNNRRVNE